MKMCLQRERTGSNVTRVQHSLTFIFVLVTAGGQAVPFKSVLHTANGQKFNKGREKKKHPKWSYDMIILNEIDEIIILWFVYML